MALNFKRKWTQEEDSVENYMDIEDVQEIEDGLKLPGKLPIPSLQNKNHIRCEEKGIFQIEWKEEQFLDVIKATYSDEQDRTVPLTQYKLEDCFGERYDFYYEMEKSVTPNIYPFLKGITGYVLLKEGLLFVKNNKFYLLSSDDRCFYYVAKNKYIIVNMELTMDGNIVAKCIVDYEKVSSNVRYERSGGDYTGYIDEYKVVIKRIPLRYKEMLEFVEKKRKK